MAPPGYVGYTPSPMGAAALKRVQGMAMASIILCAVAAALSVAELVARRAARGDARRYESGELNNTEFVEAIAGYALISVVIALTTIAAAVFSIIWLRRVASNLRALHRGTTWGPGWAIGGWFAPPGLYVIPMLMMREFWQASDPDVPVGGDWRTRPGTALPFLWFVLYSVGPLAVIVGQLFGDGLGVMSSSEQQLADQILGDQTLAVVAAGFSVTAAVVWAVFVRSLTARHRALTGEAGRPG
jgi:hypothetical protein